MFDVEQCRRHCPNMQNSATGRYLEKALVEIDRLLGELSFAANQSPDSAKMCPLCKYEKGVLIKQCALHAKIERLQAEREEVISLTKAPLDQTRKTIELTSLGQWVKTRFVHNEDFNEKMNLALAERGRALAEIERLRAEHESWSRCVRCVINHFPAM